MNLNGRISNPGEMRTFITLQKRLSVSQDAGGFPQPAYPQEYTCWGKWVNFHGSEVFSAQAAGVESGATVTIRYRSDLDETWRIVKGGLVYEIISMDDIQNRHEYLEIKVKRSKPG
jgi:SPP1 family predicted phage head-tail adaptor